jgi:drug/metabolite transporter (DMT)-like permease
VTIVGSLIAFAVAAAVFGGIYVILLRRHGDVPRAAWRWPVGIAALALGTMLAGLLLDR